jgi:hypothetical protein
MPPIKQYINLDPTKPDELNGLAAARAGRKIKLQAQVNPARKNSRLTFEVTSGANNKKHAGHVKRTIVRTNDQGIAKYTLELSRYGGDEFTVRVFGTKSGDELSSETYQVWRRFYSQLSRQDAAPRGANRGGGNIPAVTAFDIQPALDELARHYIEIVPDDRQDLIARRINVFRDADPFAPTAVDGYVANREPVGVRIILVNKIAEPTTQMVTRTLARDGFGRTSIVATDVWVDETLPKDEDWLVGARWREDEDGTAWHDVARGRLTAINLTGGSLLFHWDDVPDDVETIEMEITYRVKASGSNGFKLTNLVFIALNEDARRQQTLTHELGHFVGMVLPGQPMRYTGHDHTGQHCATGLSADQRAGASYTGLPGTCVMFGQSVDGRSGQMCADCTTAIKDCHQQVRRLGW